MKKKFLLLILMIVEVSCLNAQTIINNSSFLFIGYSSTQGPPNDRWAEIDELTISKITSNDTFFTIGDSKYVKSGTKSFMIQDTDTFLMFDEALKKGDSLFTFNDAISISVVVDSVKQIKLHNGKYYKHWYLNDLQSSGTLYVWIESLGERHMGWRFLSDIKKLHLPSLAAVCQNDDITHWDSSLSKYGNKALSQTCNFDSISQVLSVSQLTIKPQLLYPNPVQNFLTIDSIAAINYSIVDINGNTRLEGRYAHPIDVSSLKQGIYFVTLTSRDKSAIYRILKK